jgi:nucleoside-diphosphate-sugar epimerase
MRRVLLTGATGFVGRHTLPVLQAAGFDVRCAVRQVNSTLPCSDAVVVGDINGRTDWLPALDGVEVVMHLAGRAHAFDRGRAAADEYWRTNVDGTRALAEQALAEGVRKLVFVSSVKAAGERTCGQPLVENLPPAPEDGYGQTKLEAERALRRIEETGRMGVVILRPPLVFGPGVRGNFLRLLDLVQSRKPLPLAAVRNRRSLIYAENLASGLVVAAGEAVGTGTYFVADSPPVSTAELVRQLAEASGVEARLLPFPSGILRLLARSPGLGSLRRLVDDLEVDSSAFRQQTGWAPGVAFGEGIRRTVAWRLATLPPTSTALTTR